MSARVDAERRADRRHAAVERAGGIHARMGRILRLYADGWSDREIAVSFGWNEHAEVQSTESWSPDTVMRYRQVLQLCLGKPSGGRWRDAVRSLGRRT